MVQREIILTALQTSADDLARETARLPAEAAVWRTAAGEWSQAECLTHLWIAEHFVFLPRLRAMLERENPFLPLVDEVALQQQEWDPQRPRDEVLARFLAERRAEVELLGPADWARPGVHETLGPISVGWVAQYALAHTWEHMSQMARVRLRYELPGRAASG